MPTLYVTEQGATLRRTDRRLVVEKDGQRLAELPIIKVEQIFLFGNIRLTTPVIALVLEKGIDLVFLSRRGRYRGRLVGPETGNGLLRLSQYRAVEDEWFRRATAKAIVRAKLTNQWTFLQPWGAQTRTAVAELRELVMDAGRRRSVQALMGVEGRGSAVYFQALRPLFAPAFTFEGRRRRPPPDPVNAMLSYGYTLLTNLVLATIQMVGLDPYLGFLHGLHYNRPALALDLVEPFRTPIVDHVVVHLVRDGGIGPEHFEPGEQERSILLNEEGRRRFIAAYEARLATRVAYPGATGEEQVTYRRIIERQVRELARSVQDRRRTYRPYVVREA